MCDVSTCRVSVKVNSDSLVFIFIMFTTVVELFISLFSPSPSWFALSFVAPSTYALSTMP